jgi:hypothetical protein
MFSLDEHAGRRLVGRGAIANTRRLHSSIYLYPVPIHDPEAAPA